MKQKFIDIGTDNSGISIVYYKSKRRLWITGWYDHYVGIEGASMSLGRFLRDLGIDEKAVVKALQETPE